MRLLLKLLLLALCANATGCAIRDRRDAPWDPPPGRQLFEQIPAWNGAAERLCCQHLKDPNQCRPPRSDRC